MIDDVKKAVILYWFEKSQEALSAADDDFKAGRYSFAINRTYYACFYALSAVLIADDVRFVKHSGVRGALHRMFVKPGKISPDLGRFYDRLFENRQRADYQELVVFEREQTEEALAGPDCFNKGCG
ncbi:MAG: HEPN domain-containing protein [Actinomycetota bacterium]|nr:HEPN domain-containing protein [Actinomycetota bacterium]